MQRLWHDIKDHPFSAAVFLVYWLAIWVLAPASWQGSLALFLSPLLAGGLVGVWRAPAREGLLIGRFRLAGGPLAASVVVLISVAVLFVSAGLRSLAQGEWKWGLVGEWLGWSAIFGLFALVIGLLGALAGSTLGRMTNPREAQPRGSDPSC